MEGSYDPVFSGPSTPMSVPVGRRPKSAEKVVNMSASHRSPGAPSGANQYKANVNRTKTRKWVEAKTIDYGGDDWGGNDYDEEEPIEPDEPEPPLPPPPKPRSPRSSATFSNSRPASPAGPRPPPTTAHAPAAAPSVSASPGLRTPAGAPALHIQTQQHPAAQQIKTDSGSPWRQGPPSRGSTPGTDRPREISPHAVGVPQSAATSSVYSAVSEFGQLYGDRSASPSAFQGPRARRMSPGPQSASSPVPTRSPGRKSSVGQHDAPADNIYPAIHADSNQQMASRPESGHANTGAIMSPYKPWMAEGTARGPRSASPSGSTRSSNATGKPLPFVRPADIYKKLEDEKEKVRRSMDSERPSVDSLGLGRASDTASSLRTQSPTRTSRSIPRTQEQGQVRPDSDVISPGFTQTMDAPFPEEVRAERMGTSPGHDNDDSAVPRGSRTGLPTVAERKSEYGVEGLLASYEARGGTSGGTPRHKASPLVTAAESTSAPASREGVPAISPATSRLPPRSEIVGDQVGHDHHVRELPDLQKKEGAARDEALGSAHSQERGVEEVQKGEGKALEDGKNEQPGEELRQSSTSPKLPELGRLSVFGVDLFSSSSSNPPASSSSFNHPTSSPPPPLPAIPSSHAIASPNPPLSTLVESPSPSSTLPQQDDHVDEEIQGQASADRPRSGVDSRPQFPAATDTIPRQDNASRIAATSERLPEPSILRQSEPTPAEHHSSSGDSTPDSRPVSARQAGAAEESAKRPATHTPGLKDFSTAPSTVTSKSESGQQPSVDKALPAVPSEASVVTPDPQTSQLATSAPTANVSDEPRPSEEKSPNDSSTKDTKLTAHPLLAERSEQAKAVSPHASPSGSSHAATASVLSPAPAPELTPVDNQVLSPDAEPSVHEEKLVEGDGAADTSDMEISPSQPSGAPPASPVEITGGETYVSARESPSLLGDGGSPTKTDKLSAEILRSLSPASPSPATAAESSDAATRSLDGPSSAARESSFLPDLYDDYWSFAGAGNATDADAPPVPTNPMATAMPAALNVQTENIRPGLNVQTENIRPGSLVAAGDENIHRVSSRCPDLHASPF